MRIGDLWRRLRQAFTEGHTDIVRASRKGVLSRRRTTYRQVVDTGYGNPWLYRCVREIAETMAGIPWYIEEAGGRRLDMPDDPRARLLRRPTEGVALSDWIERWVTYLLLDGEVVGNLILGDRREVLALDLLEPSRLHRHVDTASGEVRYRYRRPNRSVIEIDPEMQVVWRMLDPTDSRYGWAPAAVVCDTSAADTKARGLGEVLVDLGARAGGIVQWHPDARPTPQEISDLREDINAMTTGNRQGSVYVMPRGAQFLEVGLTPREMDFERLRSMNAAEIAAVFGIAPELIGAREAKYANWQQAREALHFDTVQPLVARLQSGLNMAIEPYWRGARVQPDFSQVPALQGFFARKVDMARELVMLGYPRNVVNRRLGLGLPDLQGGDQEYPPLGMSLDDEF